MDIENPFTFFTEDKKTHLEIIIPGQPTKQTWKIHWDKSLEHDARAIKRDERDQIIRHYQKHGFLANYDAETIQNMRIGNRGWAISHPWAVPTTNPSYIRIFEKSAYWELAERLWRPLFFVLTDNMDRYPFTEYTIPVLPHVITMEFVDKWYQTNQTEAAYLNRIRKKSQQTQVTAQSEGDKIVLKIKGHPFVNQVQERILLYPTSPKFFPIHLSAEDQELLRLKLLRRDAYRLKGLSDNERTRLSHLQPIGARDNYHIHWKKWISFNGDMTAPNALLVSRDTEIKYQMLVQKPFDMYWEENWERLSRTGQQIYVDIPIPMGEYRLTPIPLIRTKHQNRYHLNRLTQEALEDYHQYDT